MTTSRRWRPIAAMVASLILATGAAQASPVVMISLDGLRPADIAQARARGLKVPHLRALMPTASSACCPR